MSRKIENVRASLGVLAGDVTEDQWEVISACRRLLDEAQHIAAQLESSLVVPTPETETTAPAQ